MDDDESDHEVFESAASDTTNRNKYWFYTICILCNQKIRDLNSGVGKDTAKK
jgi:hypothetical protein